MPPATLLAGQSYADLVRNMSGPLLGYWRLDEMSGTTARDEMNSKNGTYTSSPTLGRPSVLTGDGGSAVLFGGGKYVSMPALALTASQARTIALWVLPSYASSNLEVMFTYGTVGADGVFYVLDGAAGARNLRVFDGGVNMNANPAVVVTDQVKHLCVAVYNGTGWTFSLDGSLLGTPVAGAASASVSPTIGRSTNSWNGTIDDSAVWGRALTDYEIATLYQKGAGW